MIIGPDEESEQWVSAIAGRIGAPYAVLRKIRHGDRNVDVELPDLSEWKGRSPVLVDDIASSGQTLMDAARKLPLQGFRRPVCAVVHGVFAEESYARLRGLIDRIVSSDSIPHESNAIRLAPLIAATIGSAKETPEKTIRHRRPPEPYDEVRTGRHGFVSRKRCSALDRRRRMSGDMSVGTGHMNSTRRRSC